MMWYIPGGLFLILIIYLAYNFIKLKNVEQTPPSDKIKILNNKNFKTIIRNDLVLVDFWASWCAPCKIIAPILNEIAEEQAEKITIAKLNVDEYKQIAQKYNIRSIPTLILFENGKQVKRMMGVKPKKALLKELGLV